MTPVLLSLPLLSILLCFLVIRLGVKDAPDGGRKTQKAPVPTAGGIAIFAALAFGLLLTGDLAGLLGNGLPALVLFVLASATIGLFDDTVGLDPKLKLVLLALVSVFAAVFGPRLGHFHLPFGPGEGYGLPVWLSVAGVALWLFVMANATNFMDGSNGLAMGSAMLMFAAYAILLNWLAIQDPRTGVEMAMSHMTAMAAAAISGFLVWNLSGRLFAGDTGSLGVGALLGAAGLVVACRLTVWEPVVLTLPFLVDVFMTLLWRARAGRNLFDAHRDHAYQLLLRAGWSHRRVASLWAGMTLVCGAGLLGLGPLWGAQVIFGLLALGIGLWTWQRVTLGRKLAANGC